MRNVEEADLPMSTNPYKLLGVNAAIDGGEEEGYIKYLPLSCPSSALLDGKDYRGQWMVTTCSVQSFEKCANSNSWRCAEVAVRKEEIG